MQEVFAGTAKYTEGEQWGKPIIIYEFRDWKLFTTVDEFQKYGGQHIDEPYIR